MQPLNRRTWAPVGETPIQRAWSPRRAKLTVIGALTVSPHRQRVGQYFQLLEEHTTAELVVAFVRNLWRQIRWPLTLIMDQLPAHRKAARLLAEKYGERILVEWLPSYAPELNPCEYIWSHTKYGDLSNFVPDHFQHLQRAVYKSLDVNHHNQPLLHSYFQGAKLKP